MTATAVPEALTIAGVRAAAERLAPHVVRTPVVAVEGPRLGLPGVELVFKLELLQTTNSFKFRGAMHHVLALEPDAPGVVTVSSGNHGIALAEAGRRRNVRVVVVMGASANPWRCERIVSLGAEVTKLDDPGAMFAFAQDLARREGLRFVHPYDGPRTLEATASLGLEFAAQAGELDAVVLPIGGGGLAAGVAFALHAEQPGLAVIGAEPVGAQTMTAAFQAGGPIAVAKLETIADSLAAPIAAPMSYALCREHLSEVLLLSDLRIEAAMRAIYETLHQAIEPSAAIATAAVLGPLRDRLPAGGRIGLILCGANQEPRRQFEMLAGR